MEEAALLGEQLVAVELLAGAEPDSEPAAASAVVGDEIGGLGEELSRRPIDK